MKCTETVIAIFLTAIAANAQLIVQTGEPKITGEKAVVILTLQNKFGEKIESARATTFIVDGQGKMAGQSTQWVIGGGKDKTALLPGKETTFNFALPVKNPGESTNFHTTVTFSRLVLEGGKVADVKKNVSIVPAGK